MARERAQAQADEAHLRRHILQRLERRDYYKADGSFIGKPALKAMLFLQWPGQEQSITSAVNGLRAGIDFPIVRGAYQYDNAISSSGGAENSAKEAQSNQTGRQGGQGVQSRQAQNGNMRSAVDGMARLKIGVSSQQEIATLPFFMKYDLTSSRKTQPVASMPATLHDRSLNLAFVNENKEQSPANDFQQQIPSNPKIDALLKFLDDSKSTEQSCFARFLSEALEIKPKDIESQLLQRLDKSEIKSLGIENKQHHVKHAVLFSKATLNVCANQLPQYALLGTFESADGDDMKAYLNTNVPFSAFICGVQGSGKSHTSTCMIENLLIPTSVLGPLEKPLTALVFNFTTHASETAFLPCEAVFLAAPNQVLQTRFRAKKVKVLVSPSNYHNLGAAYSRIPGVEVRPFKLKPKDLNISTMLTLMCVDQSQGSPLYMGTVTKILRQMAELSGRFDYIQFRRRINAAGLEQKQIMFLEQRLDLLESFMDLDGSTTSLTFEPGEVTIMDLSCPFVDAGTACVLFKIGMGMFLQSSDASGKVIFMDEAHKFMTENPGAKALTESITEVIRLQRHYGARVIISTQEPTISPKLIGLCSITVIHRFTSPEWLSVLRRHISVPRGDEGDLYKQILRLHTGEALVFAPSAVLGIGGYRDSKPLDLLRVNVRRRITWDGGVSIVSV